MSFLKQLGDQINNQFSIGENNDHSLSAVVNGQNQQYGSLGDFASMIDKSAQRRYVEEGYLRKDPYTTDVKQLEILMQEPSATVLVKKRMFSSIGENYRPDFMDKDEKLYYKAMKILFQNKCRQIAALEKLSKIQKITSAVGNISEQLLPIIISLTDDAGSGFSTGGPDLFGGINNNGEISNFTKVVDRIRRIYAFNSTNDTTTWITDSTNLYQSQFGQGTGVIEITNFTNLRTTNTLSIKNPGSFSLSIVDPYESMVISDYDIEKALSDATNSFYNHKLTQFGIESAEQVINDLQTRMSQLRSGRGASPITFNISPDTVLGKRVIAIVDKLGIEIPFDYNPGFVGIGSGVTVADEYKQGGAVLGFDGLSVNPNNVYGPDRNIIKLIPDSELKVFQQLVAAIFNKLTLDVNSRNSFQTTNKNTNYARRKLRFNFSGKMIIQPMDSVHIYINSKSRYDNKLLSGLKSMFTGVGILQNINHTLTDVKNAADTLFNPSGNIGFQAEKSAYVGPDFPNYLWALIRNQFVTEHEGTHVFAGLVETAQDSWSDGKFTVDIRGTDNSGYLNMGKVNFKPGVDVFNGSLYDPLTPFKSRFDKINSNATDDLPELLDENKVLLGTSEDKSSPLVKFKLGPNAGQKVTQENYVQDSSIDSNTNFITRSFYAPDGLVYKWKEGIGVLVQFGNSLDLNNPNRVGIPTITNQPFAGQDIMNVIALLVTGKPYNFANYWKSVSNFDGFNKDPQSGQDSAYSYYAALQNNLTKNNVVWGNFIPFKNLVMDESAFAKTLQAQFRSTQLNNDLNNKLQKLSDLNKSVLLFGAANVFVQNNSNQFSAEYTKAQALKDQLEGQIQGIILNIQKEDQSFSALQNIGGDVSIDFNSFLDSSKASKQASDPSIRRQLRRQTNYLTRRMSYNVRANDDKNLFIVDDYYDKDYDILAYEQSLADGIKLYNNEFTSVKEKIVASADLLDLEVFCDSQGHLRVRPSQYNRMPSSVFYRMMYLKKAYGVQVFPEFLNDLFFDQLNSLKQRIEILEDQIRLDCAVLGINDDNTAQQFILGNNYSENSGSSFGFLSAENSGSIVDTQQLINQARIGENLGEDTTTFNSLESQAGSSKDIFTNSQKYTTIVTAITKNKLDQAGYGIYDMPAFSSNTRVDDLITRIQTKSGQRIPRSYFLTQAQNLVNNDVTLSPLDSIDIFKVGNDLSDKIRERQKVISLFFKSIKNASEFKSLDDDSNNTASELLNAGTFNNSNIPEVFEHMIEDESYDDYGIGSGSRYVIKRAQIKSVSIGENPPPFTLVEVKGVLNPLAPNSLPNGLNSFPTGGNGLVTAAAVDYDMWRNYGFRQEAPINVPFLSDPNSQCAPYASMILGRARKNILQGTMTIAGNEFMQAGEVIYYEDRGLLFYVTDVSHNFTNGKDFSTTLTLAYGHTPGEYIPVPLDIVGKIIYNNKDNSSFVVQRQSNSSNDSNIGIIQRDGKNPDANIVFDSGDKDSFISSFSSANSAVINNILYTSSYLINANQTTDNTVQASVELRIYYDNNNPVSSDLKKFANTVQEILTIQGLGPKQSFNSKTANSVNPTLKSEDVIVVTVNMDDETDFRSPSQKAIDAARNQIVNVGLSGGGQDETIASTDINTTGAPVNARTTKDKLRAALFNYVVDCWIKIEPVSTAVATSNGIS